MSPPPDTALARVCTQISLWTGLPENVVTDALGTFEAPDDCTGIETVAHHLRPLTRFAEDRATPLKMGAELRTIAEALCSEIQTVRELVPRRPIVFSQRDMYGLCSKNPEWTMIALTKLAHPYRNRLLELELLVLQIAPALRASSMHHLVECTRAIRTLSEDAVVETLGYLDEIDRNLVVAYEQLRAADSPRIDSIRLALGIVLETHSPRTRSEHSSGGGGGYQQIRGAVEAHLDDIGLLPGAGHIDGPRHYSYRALKDGRFEGEIHSADDPCDDAPTAAVLVTPPVDDDDDEQTNSTNPAYALASRSLCLPASNDVLTPRTCGKVTAGVVSALETGHGADAAVAFLIGVQLFHGVSLRDLKSASFSEASITVPVKMTFHRAPPSDWKPFLIEAKGEFRTPLCRPLARWIEDPDHASLVQRLVRSKNLTTLIRLGLTRLVADKDAVASVGRLANTFRNHMYALGADYADVVLVVGSPDRDLRWSVTYTGRDTAALEGYVREIHYQFAEYAQEHAPNIDLANPTPQSSGGVVGSLRVPSETTIRDLAKGMRDYVNSKRGNLFLFHNCFTAYTMMFLTLATASRTSAARFSRETDFSSDLWWVFVSDKDNAEFRGARILRLTPDSRAQLSFYLTHLRALEQVIGLSTVGDVASAHMFRRGDTLTEARDVEYTERHRHPGLIYLLDDSGRPFVPTMRKVSEFIAPNLFPPSFYPLRHYMRSQGRRLGIAPEVLHYGFSHWPAAASPHGMFSLARAGLLAEAFAAFTGAVMARDGWTPLGGLS
ncbi:MAG: hypothetical protein WD081_03705 [Gammaproteobacteria bacterium]